MEKLVDDGLVKQIGVANFSLKQVEDLLKTCRIKPVVNQVELHPMLAQRKLVGCLMRQVCSQLYQGNCNGPRVFVNPRSTGSRSVQVPWRGVFIHCLYVVCQASYRLFCTRRSWEGLLEGPASSGQDSWQHHALILSTSIPVRYYLNKGMSSESVCAGRAVCGLFRPGQRVCH